MAWLPSSSVSPAVLSRRYTRSAAAGPRSETASFACWSFDVELFEQLVCSFQRLSSRFQICQSKALGQLCQDRLLAFLHLVETLLSLEGQREKRRPQVSGIVAG